MNFKNAKIYTSRFRFESGAFSVENGRFVNVLGPAAEDAIDLEEAMAVFYGCTLTHSADGVFELN